MTTHTLAKQVLGEVNMARSLGLAVASSLLIAVSAQISVPMQPVPMTLQTLAVLVVGAALGMRLGAAALALYALEGAVGMPVFAEMKAGLPVLTGPTGGYIFGFILAAAAVGYLAERAFDRSIARMLLAMLVGVVAIYVPGLLWLSGFVGGMGPAVTFGLAPFWLGDLLKAVVAALAFPAVWKWLQPSAR